MNARRDLLQESLAAIDRLQAKLKESERAGHEPIAIVGAGCRYPGGVESPESLWRLLHDGVDAVDEVPADRWNANDYYDPDPKTPGKMSTKWGGFLSQVTGFDAQFFGISPREAATMDPQQRLLLETAHEALESAGLAVDTLVGSKTGVFVGITTSDYGQRMRLGGPENSDVYSATGSALNAAAGRIAFNFGFQGPCVAVDTACSSSLVAVHLACQSLRARESNLALAGGVNVILSPDAMVLFSKWGMMAPNGRCKTFDAAADGFVRSEGCAVIALKRLSDALAAGDPILAVIRGTAVNSDGRSSGLTVPNGLAQESVLRSALASAELTPADIDYVEAHGTGTSLGDPIEVEALGAVMCEGRAAERPLRIGSVKTNLGHTEAASGLAGLLKVVLSLRHETIPPHLHFTRANPAISWDAMLIEVPTKLTPWPRGSRPRRAGVSAFGFSGTNAHAILEEAPLRPDVEASVSGPVAGLVTLSARNVEAVRDLAGSYARFLREHPSVTLADLSRTTTLGRAPQAQRIALVASTVEEAVNALEGIATSQPVQRTTSGRVVSGTRPQVAFMFPGQGAQWAGMALELSAREPVVQAALQACATVLAPELDVPLLELLTRADLLDQTKYTQPALFAVEWALCEYWRSLGVEPSAVIGHSVGEYVAAVAAGVMDLNDGLRLIAARGRLMQERAKPGAMAAVLSDEASVKAALAEQGGSLVIAAVNAPDSIVVSGTVDEVLSFQRLLEARAVRVQRLAVSHAFHSPLLDPMLDAFAQVAATVKFRQPQLPLFSNLTGALAGPEIARPEYWVRHARQPVRFAAGLEALLKSKARVLIEVGPGTTLGGLGRRCSRDETLQWVATLRKDRGETLAVAEAVGQLWTSGVAVSLAKYQVQQHGRLIQLPTYPFQRERHWVEATSAAVGPQPSPTASRGANSAHPLLGTPLKTAGKERIFESSLAANRPAWLADHQLFGSVVVPGTGFLEMAMAAAAARSPAADVIQSVSIEKLLEIPADGETTVQLVLTPGAASDSFFEISSPLEEGNGWQLHARGKVSRSGEASGAPALVDLRAIRAACPDAITVSDYYETLTHGGVSYGPAFRGIRQLWKGRGQAFGMIDVPARDAATYRIHPALLDACFQVCGAAIERPVDDVSAPVVYVPIGVERLELKRAGAHSVLAHASVRQPFRYGDQTLTADITLLNDDGELVARVSGIECKRISQAAIQRASRAGKRDWLYEIQWRPTPLTATSGSSPANWLILADRVGVADALVQRLQALGQKCVSVTQEASTNFDRLLEPKPTHIVHLWSLNEASEGALSSESLREAQHRSCGSLLELVQSVARSGSPQAPTLSVITRGAVVVDANNDSVSLAAAPLVGLTRVVALEHPQFHCALIDLDPLGANTDELSSELLNRDRENSVAYRVGVRHSARLVHSTLPSRTADAQADAAVTLEIAARGSLDQLVLRPAVQPTPAKGEVTIRVRAAGLNFRDVLNALGMYPGDPGALGNECAGTVVAVGEGVTTLKVGDDVMALAGGCFGSYVLASADLVIGKPARLTFDEAATIPIAFLTAVYGLSDRAKLRRGERVLIHAAAGGVGLAAVKLAQQIGAEVFATAGSPRKRAFLAEMGVKHVLDSRTLDFAQEIATRTGGRGVDVVLNSLNGEFITRSVESLAPNGRFIEIGKRDIWDAKRMAQARPDVAYHVFDLGDVLRDDRPHLHAMMETLSADLQAGHLAPLPRTTFALSDSEAAFRYMAQAKHIGKVVVKPPAPADVASKALVGPGATYLITGGLGGLGLQVARSFVAAGAKHLVLLGRGAPSAQAQRILDEIVAAGVQVRVEAVDVADPQGMKALFDSLAATMPALGGIVHAAGVIDDGVLVQQTWERFERVFRPKRDGAWNLHQLSQHLPLSFFVLFSSASAMIGSPGQGNYTAANAFLDALAHFRRARGLPALSIGWGAWGETGMAAGRDAQQIERSTRHGVGTLDSNSALALMHELLRGAPFHVGVLNMDWTRVVAQFAPGMAPPVLELLADSTQAAANASEPASLMERLRSASGAETEQILIAYVRECAGAVLGMAAERLATDIPLVQLGLDSLMAVEVRNRVERSGGPALPLARYLDGSDIRRLSQAMLEMLAPAGSDAAGRSADDDALLDRVPDMSDAEVDAHLARLLEEGSV